MKIKDNIDIGQVFSCWTVIEKSWINGNKITVMCDCGNKGLVRAADLHNGRSKMCKACAASASRKGHGGATKGKVTSEYTSYTHMIQRCTNPNNKDYDNYGGRGITVCDVWRASYEAFLMSMGKKPDPTYTIERKDSNGNYEPGNCIWASSTTQNRNRSCNVNATLDGETKTVAEWIQLRGMEENADAVYKRLERGASPEEALTKPITSRKKTT